MLQHKEFQDEFKNEKINNVENNAASDVGPTAMFYIEEDLLSSQYEKYSLGVCKILKLIKENKIVEQLSTASIVNGILNGFDENLDIHYKEPILKVLYYMTNFKNEKALFVWNIIQYKIFELLYDNSITGHQFKMTCKIISNYLSEADQESLKNFINNHFGFIMSTFENCKEVLNQPNENEKERKKFEFAIQGCLRIFSSLCNQYESIQKEFPNFILDQCIPPFIYCFNTFQGADFMYQVIRYAYYITLWSPDEVIYMLYNEQIAKLLLSFVEFKDEKKRFYSFYSTLILLYFSKLHNIEIAKDLRKLKVFGIPVTNLPKNTKSVYMEFLLNLAMTTENCAKDFVYSTFFNSVIEKCPEDLNQALQMNKIKPFKFAKYLPVIFINFSAFREPFIRLLSRENLVYYFAVTLSTAHKNKVLVSVIECFNILLKMIGLDTEVGIMLRGMLLDRIDDIIEIFELAQNDTDITPEMSSALLFIIQEMERIAKECK